MNIIQGTKNGPKIENIYFGNLLGECIFVTVVMAIAMYRHIE